MAGELQSAIATGAWIGVLGGGQLGRMFAMAAQRLGYHVRVLADAADSPGAQTANGVVVGDYRDPEVLKAFCHGLAVATYEFENVPTATAELVAQSVPLRPGRKTLEISQHRRLEKQAMADAGIPVVDFAPVRDQDELAAAGERLGDDAILKTAREGYDGKGQRSVRGLEALANAWQELGEVECVLERRLDLACEFSVIVARTETETAVHGPFINVHRQHILDTSRPLVDSDEIDVAQAVEIAQACAIELDCLGLLCVEFFLDAGGMLRVNEIAPRPHNSGHLTIEGHVTSQFEQAVRAVCGLPLGDTRLARPVAMANLLGDLWQPGTPRFEKALAMPGVALHLYGKHEARPGRKMGHLTASADTPDAALRLVLEARAAVAQP